MCVYIVQTKKQMHNSVWFKNGKYNSWEFDKIVINDADILYSWTKCKLV